MSKTPTVFALLFALLVVLPVSLFAQMGQVTGKVSDEETGEPLILAQIEVVGTQFGATTDLDGKFSIVRLPAGQHTVKATYLGYSPSSEMVTIPADGKANISFNLSSNAIAAKEITVLVARASRRETPVSFTDIPKAEIVKTLGSRDVPIALRSAPSVYTSETGGGAGDSRINIRGFGQRNVAVMINGVPVNDMENGWVYWSNWDGLGDVTSSIQMQRGMGSSNLAISSVGGTLNVITDAAAMAPAVSLKQEIANDAFLKSTFSASSGLLQNKFAISGAIVRKSADGYVAKTWTDAWAYFLGMSYIPMEGHKFDFYAVGAPQQHGQRSFKQRMYYWDLEYAKDNGADTTGLNLNPATAAQVDLGIDFNPNWGRVGNPGKEFWNDEEHDAYAGDYLNSAVNYFHKPQINLNWYWNMSEKLLLTNVVYYSQGNGGGTGTYGSGSAWNKRLADGTIDIQSIYNTNSTNIDPTLSATEHRSTAILRNSVNIHSWYGWLGSANYELNDAIDLKGGLDYRHYLGEHWREVRNLVGGDYYFENFQSRVTGVDSLKRLGDKINYHNDGDVGWFGGFGTIEYKKDRISGFGNVSFSNTSYKRIDYFQPAAMKETDVKGFPGFGIKAGLNYNVSEMVNAFGNFGILSIAPAFDAVFTTSNTEYDDVTNEGVNSFEIGTGFYHPERLFDANVSFYNTTWSDKTVKRSSNLSGTNYSYLVKGLDAVHTGFEVSGTIRPHHMFEGKLAASFGNWEWQKDVTATYIPDDNPTQSTTFSIFTKGLKVGDSPQSNLSLSGTAYPVKGLYTTLNFDYYMDYYSNFLPENRVADPNDAAAVAKARMQAWKIPNYGLLDFHTGYRIPMKFAGVSADVALHIFNLLDTKYIGDADDGNDHDALTANVFFGRPRTWNLGINLTL